MTVPAMNPFAMLLDSTAAIQAHEKVQSSLRAQVHKRADAMPRHLQPDVIEYDKAIEQAATTGKAAPAKPRAVRKAKTSDVALNAKA